MESKNIDALDVISMKISCLEAQIDSLKSDELECISNADFNIPLIITLDCDNEHQVTLSTFRNGKIHDDMIYCGGDEATGWMIFDNVGDALDVAGILIVDGVYQM